MEIRKIALALTAMSMVWAGCDGLLPTDQSCTADTDCQATELCHPDAKVCVQTCTAAADCPDSSKLCEMLGGTSENKDRMICKCQTDALCNTDRATTDQVCSTQYGICATKCTADLDCGMGNTCDTATGQCKKGSTTGASCSGEGKSTCNYAEFCDTGTCKAAPVAPTTCENFATNRPAFDAATSNGPIIYSVAKKEVQVGSSYCDQTSPSDAFIVTVKAYRTDANWPDTRSQLSGFFYVRTNTSRLDIVGENLLIPNTGYNRNPTNPKEAEFNVYLCRPAGAQTLQVGFYFTGGNPVCAQINR